MKMIGMAIFFVLITVLPAVIGCLFAPIPRAGEFMFIGGAVGFCVGLLTVLFVGRQGRPNRE